MSGIKAILGSLFGQAGDILDEVITTDEERKEAKRKLKQLILNHEADLEKEITARWAADMQNGTWLSRNIRPLVLAFLVVSTIIMVFIDAGALSFDVKDTWVDLLQLVLITVIGAYFGGRSFEKHTQTKNYNK